jgi:hypothetical protein
MEELCQRGLDRRDFLTVTIPACSMACLGASCLLAATGGDQTGDLQGSVHKFDVEFEQKTTLRKQTHRQNRSLIQFIKSLQGKMDEKKLIALLNDYSAQIGRDIGSRQAKNTAVKDFQTFTQDFRPPRLDKFLTMEIVEDTPKVFELRVTECIWATVFREAGLGGEIGHATVCNMDYYWPKAFNENFKMERDKTLMQGHDCCNHRYIDTA